MPEPIQDSIEVAPSEESGNVPAEAPSEQPQLPPEPPADNVEGGNTPAESTPAEPELFELPDGRKVDAATLAHEWKENFMPDYTRKSQELAKKGGDGKQDISQPDEQKPYDDPNYQPESFGEIVRAAKEEALKELEARQRAEEEHRQSIENQVIEQLTEIKKTDPTLNENALFLHANKYGFRDLRQAHQNMKDMSEAMKKVKQTTAAEVAKRQDPVSVSPGAPTGGAPDPGQFGNAVEYLRSLK